jgi:hypothetical protein
MSDEIISTPPRDAPEESPDAFDTDNKPTKPKAPYSVSFGKCVICGGRHDRRDRYGRAAVCAQCLADLRHERLSQITPAVMRGYVEKTKRRGEKSRK